MVFLLGGGNNETKLKSTHFSSRMQLNHVDEEYWVETAHSVINEKFIVMSAIPWTVEKEPAHFGMHKNKLKT